MNRHVKFVLFTAVLASLVFALAAIGWRIHMVHNLGLELRPRPLAPFILLAVPAVLAVILWRSDRLLAEHGPGVSDENPRHLQASLIFTFVFTALCTAWMGLLYVAARPPEGELLIRLTVGLMGLSVAIRANLFAKLSPPALDRPFNRDAWSRAALRAGWGSVGIGLVLIAAAAVLPLKPLFFACLAGAAALILLSLALRRAVRPG